MSGQLVNLITPFLVRHRPSKRLTSVQFTFFVSKWQLGFLNRQKEENDHWWYFQMNLNKRMVPDRSIEPATTWLPVPVRYISNGASGLTCWKNQSEIPISDCQLISTWVTQILLEVHKLNSKQCIWSGSKLFACQD